MDWERWQRRWDAQQSLYLPDREDRFAAMLDVVEAAGATAPFVLDLAGGTGSITRRLLTRFPGARCVVLDVDPALLAIATATFAGDDRVRICRADLAHPAWVDSVRSITPAPITDGSGFDAVLTATALHWLTPERVAAVYAESVALLGPGGVIANADHIPDPGLAASLTPALSSIADRRLAERRSLVTFEGVDDWDGWWESLGRDPELAALVAERNVRFADRRGTSHAESRRDAAWHVRALVAAGCTEAGIVWRHAGDAVVVGVTSPGVRGAAGPAAQG